MDANVCDNDHNPTNCYLTVTTRIVFDRAADQTRDKKRSGAASPSSMRCAVAAATVPQSLQRLCRTCNSAPMICAKTPN